MLTSDRAVHAVHADLFPDRNEKVTFQRGLRVSFRIAPMENAQAYISKKQAPIDGDRDCVGVGRLCADERRAGSERKICIGDGRTHVGGERADAVAEQTDIAAGRPASCARAGVAAEQLGVERLSCVDNGPASCGWTRTNAARERAGFGEGSDNAAKVPAEPFSQQGDDAKRRTDWSPLARGIRQAFMYYGVSIVQTFVEFGMFALAQLALPTGVANGIAVACSGSFNFLMNRNITFKASSNFWRSVALFVALYVWNFLFGTWFIGWAAASFGCPEMVGKFITMAMQGIWGFCLCKWVIFR